MKWFPLNLFIVRTVANVEHNIIQQNPVFQYLVKFDFNYIYSLCNFTRAVKGPRNISSLMLIRFAAYKLNDTVIYVTPLRLFTKQG